MTNQMEEVAAINFCVETINNFKSTTFRRSADVIHDKYNEQNTWILANKPAEIFMVSAEEYTFEWDYNGCSCHDFYCRNKEILDAFVDELELLFHY